jgi:hypothetical protein
VHKRAIADAVGDDVDPPICDSSDLRLLWFLRGGTNCPCLRIALYDGRCGHTITQFLRCGEVNNV